MRRSRATPVVPDIRPRRGDTRCMTNNNGPAPTFGITERQILELRREAVTAGDWLQVAICDLARGVTISRSDAAKHSRTLRAYGYSIRPDVVCTADIVRAWASCAATIRDVDVES